jgi:hypothetical protein
MSHASSAQDLNLGSTKDATDVVSVFNGASFGAPDVRAERYRLAGYLNSCCP